MSRRLSLFFSSDLAHSRTGIVLSALIQCAALAFGLYIAVKHLGPFVRTPAPAPLPPYETRGDRLGIPLARRREIFNAVAATESASRAGGTGMFPTHPWSAEDERGASEHRFVESIAQRFSLSKTHVYLILDEGIRERWPGPDGQPLRATVVPLRPRVQ